MSKVKGIKIIAPLNDLSSMGEISRRFTYGLHKSDTPITIKWVSIVDTKVSEDAALKTLTDLIDRDIEYNVVISFLNPTMSSEYLRKESKDKFKVIYFNVNCIGQFYRPWSLFINTYSNECWVPGQWNKKALVDSGIKKPIETFPIPVFPSEVSAKVKISLSGGETNTVSDSTYVFYTSGRWGEKKNFIDTLESYWSEFSKDDDVCLALKVYGEKNSPQDLYAITKYISNQIEYGKYRELPQVLLLSDLWPRKHLVGLHKKGNCFIDTSRSGGVPINLLDAAMFGNDIITHDFGEQSTYFTGDRQEVHYFDKFLRPVVGIEGDQYNPKQLWAQAGIESLKKTMRECFNSYKNVRKESKDSKDSLSSFIKDKFNIDKVVQSVLEHLNKVVP